MISGFDIRVGNHTELIGAATTGSAEASKNNLTTTAAWAAVIWRIVRR